MTTYTFVPKSSTQFANWNDPTAWAGGVVPNAADADVVFPLVTMPSFGSVYVSYITIPASASYVTRSVNDMDGYLDINGSLSVSGALSLGANAEVDLAGGSLSFGSLTSAGYDIQGSGQVSTPGTLTNTQRIIGSGLTVVAGGLLNPGSLIASGTLTIRLTGGDAGSDFAGGVLTGGTYQALAGGTLILASTDTPITAIAATVEVAAGGIVSASGDIQSYDPSTASTLPLQQTLQTILASGDLVVQSNQYTTSHALTDAGTIALQYGTLTTPGLTVSAAGQVVGFGTVAGPIQNNGLIKVETMSVSGGNLEPKLVINGPVTGTGTLAIAPLTNSAASTLEIAGSDAEPVSFGDGSGTLILDNPATFTGAISVAPTLATAFLGSQAFNPGLLNDTVILAGIAASSVTGTSFTATATGGVLTLQEGAAQQSLTFVGSNLSLASFALSAGPQALSTTPPSTKIVVTEGPAAPTLMANGGGTKAIVNTPTPTVTGTTGAGTTVAVSANGVAEGKNSQNYPYGTSSTENYGVTLGPALHPGLQQVIATASNAVGTATSAPLSLDVLPLPSEGITTVAETSLDIATVLGQGYSFQLSPGTEAVQLTNGTLSVGPDTMQAFVQRLYEGLLGRAGDTAGLEGFNAALANGGSPADVATSILSSGEYQASHGAPQTDTQFVNGLYQSFLGRAADQAGLTGYLNALAGGISRGQVAAIFAQSFEAKNFLGSTTAHVWVPDPQGSLVTELYETGLGRAPDLGSLQGWEQQLSAGLTPLQLAGAIATSAEFNAQHAGSSNAAFVTSLYGAGLGRTPGAGELQGWVGQLQAGAGSTNVLYGIATSAEAANHLLPTV